VANGAGEDASKFSMFSGLPQKANNAGEGASKFGVFSGSSRLASGAGEDASKFGVFCGSPLLFYKACQCATFAGRGVHLLFSPV
jgi:hypothetical protein